MSEAPSELIQWVRAYLEQDEDIIVPVKKMWNEWYAAQGTPSLAEFTRVVLADDLVEEMPGVDHTGQMEGMSPELHRVLLNYDWPGNVRELKNAIERAMILEEDKTLTPAYLPIRVTSPESSLLRTADQEEGGEWKVTSDGRRVPVWEIPAGGTRLEEVERVLVEQALKQAHGNQSRAARLLDISRDALRYKIKKFRLEPTK